MRQQYPKRANRNNVGKLYTTMFSTRIEFSFSGVSDMKVDRSSGCQACKSCISMLFIQQQQIHIISQMVSFNFTMCETDQIHTKFIIYFLLKNEPSKLPLIYLLLE